MIKYNLSQDIILPKIEKNVLLQLLTFINKETKDKYIIELNIFYNTGNDDHKSIIKYQIFIKTKDNIIYNFIEFKYQFSFNSLNDSLMVGFNSIIEMLLKWMCFSKSIDITLNNGKLINYKSFIDLVNMDNIDTVV